MLVYVVIIRLHTIINPIPYELGEEDGFLVEVFFNSFSSPLTQAILAIVLIYIQALLINRIGIKHKLNKDFGLLPGVFYALFLSLYPQESALSPSLLANTFIIIALQYIITTYNKREVSANVFSSGMYASIASIFYFPYLYFFVITTIGFLIMRSFSFKERVQHLIGWLIPYILIWVYQFWYGHEKSIIPYYFHEKYGLLNFELGFNLKEMIVIGIIGFLIITFLVQYGRFSSKRDITTQKKIDIFYWVLFYGGLSILFYAHTDITHFAVIALPFGYLLAMSIVNINNLILRELFHILFVVLVIYVHYY